MRKNWFVEIVDLPLDPTLEPCSRLFFVINMSYNLIGSFKDIYRLILWRQPGAISSSPPNPFGNPWKVIATTGKPSQLAFTCRAPFWFPPENLLLNCRDLKVLADAHGHGRERNRSKCGTQQFSLILWGKRKRWQLNHVYQCLSMFAYFLECVLVSTAYSLTVFAFS